MQISDVSSIYREPRVLLKNATTIIDSHLLLLPQFPPIKAVPATPPTPNQTKNSTKAQRAKICTRHRRAQSGDHGRGPDGLLRPAPRRRPARHPGGRHGGPPQPGAPGLLPLRRGAVQGAAAPAAVRGDRRPGRLQVPQGDIHPGPHRPRPLPPRPRGVAAGTSGSCGGGSHRSSSSRATASSCDGRRAGVGGGTRAGAPAPAEEPDAGLHEAEPDHVVGRDVRDVHLVLLVRDRRRGERVQGAEPGLRRQAAAVRAQEEALRRRALRGQHHGQPMPLLQAKKEQSEDDDQSTGGEREDRRHPAGRVLVEEVRAEAHQGIPLPTRLLQVQHRTRLPGPEARGARAGRPGDAGGDLRGRAPPLAGPDADGAVAAADADCAAGRSS